MTRFYRDTALLRFPATADLATCEPLSLNPHTHTLRDLQSHAHVAVLEGHTSNVKSIAVTPDGRRAVSRDSNGAVRVWDLEGRLAQVRRSDMAWSGGWVSLGCFMTIDHCAPLLPAGGHGRGHD